MLTSDEAKRLQALGVQKRKENQRNGVYKEQTMLKEKLREKLEEVNKKNKASVDEITDALITQAKMGNVKAYEVIRDTIGEKPVDNISAQIEPPTFVKDLKK